jgi:hypothetical protein
MSSVQSNGSHRNGKAAKTPYYGVQASNYAENQRAIKFEMEDGNYRGHRRDDQPSPHLRIHTADAPEDPTEPFHRMRHPIEHQRREQLKAKKAREKAISVRCAFEIQNLKNIIECGRSCFVQHHAVFGRIFKQALPALIMAYLLYRNQPDERALPKWGFSRYGRHWTFNTYEELEAELGFPERSIRRWCQRLKKEGWLRIRSARVQGHKTNLFSLNRAKLINAVLNNAKWSGYSLIPRNIDFGPGDPLFDQWAELITHNKAVRQGRKNDPVFNDLLAMEFDEHRI